MTLIEFFNNTASENICASLASEPSRVFLIGDKMKVLQKDAERYKKLIISRGHEAEYVCRTINKNNFQNIVDDLAQ